VGRAAVFFLSPGKGGIEGVVTTAFFSPGSGGKPDIGVGRAGVFGVGLVVFSSGKGGVLLEDIDGSGGMEGEGRPEVSPGNCGKLIDGAFTLLAEGNEGVTDGNDGALNAGICGSAGV
jgi:hypothetical protein